MLSTQGEIHALASIGLISYPGKCLATIITGHNTIASKILSLLWQEN